MDNKNWDSAEKDRKGMRPKRSCCSWEGPKGVIDACEWESKEGAHMGKEGRRVREG